MCPLAKSKRLGTGTVLGRSCQPPLQSPGFSLHMHLYQPKCAQEPLMNALQEADLDKGAPRFLSFSFETLSLSDVDIDSCLDGSMHPI